MYITDDIMQKSINLALLAVAICILAVFTYSYLLLHNQSSSITPATTITTTTAYTTAITTTILPVYYSNFSVSNSINTFSFNIYSKLFAGTSEANSNIVFSPFSLFAAMSIAARGASGNTLSQMQQTLYLPSNFTAMDSSFSNLLNSLKPTNNSYNLSIADSLWIDKAFNATYVLNQSLASKLASYYDSSLHLADFSGNPIAATEAINQWIANKTGNLIKKLIPEGGITSDTVSVIVNAIYFYGKWEHQFDINDTRNSTFYGLNGSITVPMMYESADAGYFSNSTLQAVELDYVGGKIAMVVILPSNSSIQNLSASMSSGKLTNIISGMSYQTVDILLPRFNFSYTSDDLVPELRSLGITDAFIPMLANFSNMYINHSNSAMKLYISQVLQKAVIRVNETGTKAAAATAVIMNATATPFPNVPLFDADKPFMFFIIDKQTNAILFMGQVVNPLAH